ncbi:hypothetical protein BDR22DRAFT_833154 [Usnea florida]
MFSDTFCWLVLGSLTSLVGASSILPRLSNSRTLEPEIQACYSYFDDFYYAYQPHCRMSTTAMDPNDDWSVAPST